MKIRFCLGIAVGVFAAFVPLAGCGGDDTPSGAAEMDAGPGAQAGTSSGGGSAEIGFGGSGSGTSSNSSGMDGDVCAATTVTATATPAALLFVVDRSGS